MSTTIRPEVSVGNQYWISKHRYYELKHFCLQYNEWKKLYFQTGLKTASFESVSSGLSFGRPTESLVEIRERLIRKIDLVNNTAIECDPENWRYILIGVTTGLSYDCINARETIPIARDAYYTLYRKFFWLLSNYRD